MISSSFKYDSPPPEEHLHTHLQNSAAPFAVENEMVIREEVVVIEEEHHNDLQ